MIIVGAVVATWVTVQITREAPSDIKARYSKMAPDLASVFGGDERENRCIIEAANRIKGVSNYAKAALDVCRAADHLSGYRLWYGRGG
jgi:hypothetical protein